MADLTGNVTIFGENVSVAFNLDEVKATRWIEGYIKAKGYDQLGLTIVEQAQLALADAGYLWRNTALQYEKRQARKANRLIENAIENEVDWDSGITLPG